MRRIILLLLLLAPLPLLAQGGERIGQATQNLGGYVKVLPGAQIVVCPYNVSLVCTSTVPIYSDASLTLPLSNPLNADSNGNYYYFAPSANYLEQIGTPGVTLYTIPVTLVGAAAAAAGGTNGQVQYNQSGGLGGFTVSGDATLATSSGILTLATVNSNVGTCGDASHVPQLTLNAKGLTTACTPISIVVGGSVTSFGANNLSPLFTTSVANPTSTPVLSFALSNAPANTIYGNNTGGSAPPTFFNFVAPVSLSSVTSQWVNAYNASTGTFGTSQPAVSDVTGAAPLASPTFTGTVTMPAPIFNNILSSTQCLQVNSSGQVSGTGTTCGSGSGTVSSFTGDSLLITNSGSTGGVTVTVGTAPSHKFWNGAWTQPAISDLTATFSPPLSLTSNTLSCPTCVVASSPGAGIAHFAGATQTVTSSAVSLTADVTGILPSANGGTGINNTASLTLGTSSQNWATLASGIVRNTTTTGALASAELSGDATTSGSNAVTVVSTHITGGTNTDLATFNSTGNLVNYGGATSCTNQFMTGLSAAGASTCTTATLASAQFANQGTTTTVLHGNAAGNPAFGAVVLTTDVSGILPSLNGGTGVANTAFLTLGTSNQNWATLGTGIVKNTTTTGNITNAASSDVITLWTGACSSSTYLNGAGVCATPAGAGNTTSTSLTSGTIPVANGANSIINSLLTDNGTTLGYTGTGGLSTTKGTFSGLVKVTSGTLELPTGAGFTATSVSQLGIDSTANAAHFWSGNADMTAIGILSGGTLTTGNIQEATGPYSIDDTGIPVANVALISNLATMPVTVGFLSQTTITTPPTLTPFLPTNMGNYCLDSGTTNSIVCAPAFPYTAYVTGDEIRVKMAHTTTGATVMNVNSIGSVSVTDTSGGAITTNLVAGGIYSCRYTSTGPAFQCIIPGTGGGGVTSVTGDGTLISNSVSTGAVTLTLGSAASNTFWGTPGGGSPTYGKVNLPSLATQAANTVVANNTGSTAAPTAVALSAVANRYVELTGDVAQGSSGCSNDGSFLAATAPTCFFQAGGSTTPQQAFRQFTAAGALGTGTAFYFRKLVPSNYTTNANFVVNFLIADHVSTSGTVTFSVRYCAVTPGAVANQCTFFTTDYGTGAVAESGTIDNWVTGTATITPNTSSSPALHPGDLIYGVVYLSAHSASQQPYIYAYASY